MGQQNGEQQSTPQNLLPLDAPELRACIARGHLEELSKRAVAATLDGIGPKTFAKLGGGKVN